MTGLLLAASLYATLGLPVNPVTETKVVTITSARKCGALAEAEKQNPSWDAVKVRPAESGKTMNDAWVVTLQRETKVLVVRSERKCFAMGEANDKNPGWTAVAVRAMNPGATDNVVWLVTLKRD